MQFHPYSEIFPLLTGADLEGLAADIKANGQREPIWLFDGKVLDGRNRFLACQKAGVRCAHRIYRGDDPLGFVVSLNVSRRHLTESQRGMAAARIATLRQGIKPANLPVSTQTTAAETFKVSERTVRSARKVIEHGSPELQRAVEAGEVSVSRAASVAALPTGEQLAAAKAPADIDENWKPDADEDAYARLLEQEMAASIDKVFAADDRLAAAHEEIKRQAAEIATLKLSRDGYLNRTGELTRLVKREQNKLTRFERRVGELEAQNESLRERVALMEEAAA